MCGKEAGNRRLNGCPENAGQPRYRKEDQRLTIQGAAAKSLVRVHNFSISLDGFGTGAGQSRDAPFGHAGERLHEWMFDTRWWQDGLTATDTGGVDDAFAQRHE